MAGKSSRLNIPSKYSIKPVKDINFELTSEEVNQIVAAVNNNENFFSSEIQETKNIVMAISAGEGGVMYDTLAAAQAIDPKPANGIVFQVSKKTDPDNAGVYSFQSSEPGGTRPEHPLYVNNTEVVKKVDTLAEARALHGLLDGQAIYILGRDAKGDGLICDKPFYYFKDDLTAENGGTVFTATGGTLKAAIYNFVDVKWFGALGDGNADDTDAIIKSFSLGLHTVINLPDNYYKTSSRLYPTNSVTGIGSPEIRIDSATGVDGKTMIDVVNYQGEGMIISGLTVNGLYDGIGTAGEHSHAIRVKGSKNVIIEHNSLINNYGDGVYIGSTPENGACKNVKIYNNYIDNPRRCNVAVVACDGVRIRDNKLTGHNGYVGIIDIEPNLDPLNILNDIVIEGNEYEGNSLSNFVVFLDPNNKLSKGLSIKNNKGSAYNFFVSSEVASASGIMEDINIDGNTFESTVANSRFVVLNEFTRNTSISKNNDFGLGSWRVDYQDGVQVFNNNIDSSREVAIGFNDCDNVNFSGNRIKDIGSYSGAVYFKTHGVLAETKGHIIANNQFINTNCDIAFGEIPCKNTLIDGNIFDGGNNRAINIENTADGSEINITPNNIFKGAGSSVVGSQYLLKDFSGVKDNSITYGSAIPAKGTFAKGAIHFNTNFSDGEPVGWKCITAGAPGSWVAFGSNYEIENSLIRVKQPKGGVLSVSGSSVGAIKVALPVLNTDTMMHFDVDVYNHITGKSFKVLVSGFNGSSGWDRTSTCIVSGVGSVDFDIRFGNDGVKSCIWIGETNTSWAQLGVTVNNFFSFFGGVSSQWSKGWALSIVSDFETVDITESGNLPYSDGGKTKNLYDTAHSWSGKQTFQDAEFTAGATGNFTTADGKTVTVTKGIITNIV